MAPLATVFVFFYFLAFCLAEAPNQVFQWQFTASVSTQLPSCQALSILTKPFNATGTTGIPPFYMLSFPANGLPKTDFIGTDPSSLTWTVDHPIGSSLMLSVVDSTGSAGGIPPQMYTVVTGQSTACIDEPSTPSDFTVSSNVTGTITTCQPWGIRIKGGVPPYNLTLIANDSPIVTNVTLGPVDDAFTYIDRADPNRQLIAAVNDFTGRWAYGTPIVTTQGSPDFNCTGLVSSSGNATVLDNQDKAAAAALAAARNKKRTSIIAGVVVSVLVVLALVAAWYFFIFRKKEIQSDPEKEQDLTVDPFHTPPLSASESTPGQVLSITSFISSPSSPKSPRRSSYSGFPSQTQASTTSPVDSRPSSSGMSRSKPSFVAFPRSSTRGSAKAAEAAADAVAPTPPSPRSPSSSNIQAEDGPNADYVYQHRDGGRVQELPPPYMNPSRPATPVPPPSSP